MGDTVKSRLERLEQAAEQRRDADEGTRSVREIIQALNASPDWAELSNLSDKAVVAESGGEPLSSEEERCLLDLVHAATVDRFGREIADSLMVD